MYIYARLTQLIVENENQATLYDPTPVSQIFKYLLHTNERHFKSKHC